MSSRVRIWAVGASPTDYLTLENCPHHVEFSVPERVARDRYGRPIVLTPPTNSRWASSVVLSVHRRHAHLLSATSGAGTPRPLAEWLRYYVAVSGVKLLVMLEPGGSDSAGNLITDQRWYQGTCGPLPPWLLGNRAIGAVVPERFDLEIIMDRTSGEGTYTSFDSLTGLTARSV